MSPKLIRLMFVATVVTGLSAPMLGVHAAGETRSVDAFADRFEVPAKAQYEPLEINKDDTVRWNIMEGEHTVTAKDRNQWGGTGSPGKLTQTSEPYAKKFTTPGDYYYFCEIHGANDPDNKLTGMWGFIRVNGPTTTTQPPPPPASSSSTTTTTRPSATPPATSATAPTTRPTPTTAAPAPTPTTAKADKDRKKDGKEEETTTTSSTTLPAPVDLPNEAIVPTLPGLGAAPGSDAEAPIDTPEGEAVALLRPKKNSGGDAVKLLIVSGLGLGALGVGTAGYKYANRSSKYFPA